MINDRRLLTERLLTLFRSPAYKPPVLPAVALELIALSRKPTASYATVVEIVERDPLLAARLLTLSKSPVYGAAQRTRSLQEALSRLGMSTLRDIVWQVVLNTRVFRAPAYTGFLERIQSHGTCTAYLARLVATAAGVPAEHAFLCGLLHDVGWSGGLVAFSEQAPVVADSNALLTAIDAVHVEAGAAMASIWGLDSEIVEVIGMHHDKGRPGQPCPPLVHVLCVAEQLAEEANFAIESIESEPRLSLDENLVGRFEHALQQLGLEDRLTRLRHDATELTTRLSRSVDGS